MESVRPQSMRRRDFAARLKYSRIERVADELSTSVERISAIHRARLSGGQDIIPLLDLTDLEFDAAIVEMEAEADRRRDGLSSTLKAKAEKRRIQRAKESARGASVKRKASSPGTNSNDDIATVEMNEVRTLRWACTTFGSEAVAAKLGVSVERVDAIRWSKAPRDESIAPLLEASEEELECLFAPWAEAAARKKEEADRKSNGGSNDYDYDYYPFGGSSNRGVLIDSIERARDSFAGIGTNKAKRRLNKLAVSDPISKAVRLALEIEDVNINAKKYPGSYRDRNYGRKSDLIDDLVVIFVECGWRFGVQKSDVAPATHVIYFDIPGCEQLSWHFTPGKGVSLPTYPLPWDEKECSSLSKLEVVAKKLLGEAGLL